MARRHGDRNITAAGQPEPTPRVDPRRRDETAATALAAALLLAYIDRDSPRVAQLMTGIDQLGEAGMRTAWAWAGNTMVRWHNGVRHGLTLRSSTLIPAIEAIVNRMVPAAKMRGVQRAQLDIYMRITSTPRGEGGSGLLFPRPTSDAESDLYLMAAYAAYVAGQTVVQEDRVRAEIVAHETYFAVEGRLLGTTTLTPDQLRNGFTVLGERFGKKLATSISPSGAVRTDVEDDLLGVACEHHHTPSDTTAILLDVFRQNLQERRDDAAQAHQHDEGAAPPPVDQEGVGLSKAKRNRAKKAQQTTGHTASAGLPHYLRGIPEREINDTVEAWSLLNVYLQLWVELDPSYPIPDEVSAQDPVTARKLAEGLAGFRPHAILGLQDDAAYFASRIFDFTVAAKAILAEPRAWLRKSGHPTPDLRQWFTGAQTYVPLMVAEKDRKNVLALLDYDNLMAGSDNADILFGTTEAMKAQMPPMFSLDDFGHSNLWFYVASQFERTAALHAVACLTIWLFFQPGAVKDPDGTALALTERGHDAFKFVSARRGQSAGNATRPT